MNEWIKVEDRLPEEECYVWVWCEEFIKPELAEYYINSNESGFCYSSCGKIFGVTHWMRVERPAPPRE